MSDYPKVIKRERVSLVADPNSAVTVQALDDFVQQLRSAGYPPTHRVYIGAFGLTAERDQL